MQDKIAGFLNEYQQLLQDLSNPAVFSQSQKLKELSRRKKELEPLVALGQAYQKIQQKTTEAESLLGQEKDQEILILAKQDLEEGRKQLFELEEKIKLALIPHDPNDPKNIILEIRAGTGGEEASLFAAELLRMYSRYAEKQGWQLEEISRALSEEGGLKEMVLKISGEGVFGKMKYESGTHRVQRVPITEVKGRLHTSTATVAVLPEAEEIDIEIKPEDLEMTTCRSSGAGGQHVNKTDSAVRLVHKPSGLAVECQDERSQHKNREKALSVLRSRLYAQKMEKQHQELANIRSSQVGTGERAEKIRTYNFPQDRVTDHRLGENFSNIPGIMDGGIGKMIEQLILQDQAQKLAGQ